MKKMTTRLNVAIKTKSMKEFLNTLSSLYALGFQFMNHDTLQEFLENEKLDEYFPTYSNVLLQWDEHEEKNGIDFSRDISSYSNAKVFDASRMTLLDITKYLNAHREKVVKISRDYNAVVTKEHIQVGCQTINFDDFDKLVEAVKEIRNGKH